MQNLEIEKVGEEDDEFIHVYPDFGREHIMSLDCWCWPEYDLMCSFVVIHNVEN